MVVPNRLMFENEEEIEAVGYIRQSDERSDKEDISEQTQLSKIQQYCDFNGWKLVKVFKDIDYSGFRIRYTKRPGLMEAFEYVKTAPKVKKFVIFNLSRATRLKKDFNLIQETLNSFNIDICSASETLDFSTPTGRLIAGVLVDFNEYYSDNLSDITMASKKTNAEKGRWNGGPFPFGIISHGVDIISDGIKGDIVSSCFKMARSGKGPFIIAKWLKNEGVKTETGVEWSPRRVRYMLTNPTYAAMQKWEDQYYPLKFFPQLVSWDDFQYIQRTLFGKEKAWKGKDRQLLSSMLRCPVCGGKMHARKTQNKKNRRYVCGNKNAPGGCRSPVIDLATLDIAVLTKIVDISKKRYSINRIASEFHAEDEGIGSSLQQLRTELENLEFAQQKVFDDYYVNRKLEEQQFNFLMRRYEESKKEIQRKLEKIPIPNTGKFGDLDDLFNSIGDALFDLNKNDKRIMTELIIEKIVPSKVTQVHFKWGEVHEIHCKKIRKNRSEILFY